MPQTSLPTSNAIVDLLANLHCPTSPSLVLHLVVLLPLMIRWPGDLRRDGDAREPGDLHRCDDAWMPGDAKCKKFDDFKKKKKQILASFKGAKRTVPKGAKPIIVQSKKDDVAQ